MLCTPIFSKYPSGSVDPKSAKRLPQKAGFWTFEININHRFALFFLNIKMLVVFLPSYIEYLESI